MNKLFYDEIINVSYKNYLTTLDYYQVPLSKDEFIEKIKSDKEFSEICGLQIEDRELEYKERYNVWFMNNYETGMERNYNVFPDFDDPYYEPTPKSLIIIHYTKPIKILL